MMNIMKKLLLILFILIPMICAGQTYKVLYLNNGNVVKGELVEETSTTVVIKMADGDTRSFRKVEIRKMSDIDNEAIPYVDNGKPYVDYIALDKGFWAAVEVGSGVNIHITNDYKSSIPTELTFTGGYRYSKFFQIGAGIGVRYYFSGDDRVCVRNRKPKTDIKVAFPLFVNARGLIIDDRSRSTVPYWSANLGYTINDGFYFSPSIGLRMGSLNRNHFLIGDRKSVV